MSQCSEERDTIDTGYFASTEQEDEDVEESAEPWYKYNKENATHVFYPTCIGEILDQRYRIEHKLGHGGLSTVWMARDLQNHRDVALKIIASGGFGEFECQIQQEILKNVPDTTHLVTYLSTFYLRGDHDSHQVLVFPLLGESLNGASVTKKSMATRMSAARQLLEALESLHKAGIVHRDINESNCMWGMVPLDNLSMVDKYKVFGRPLKQALISKELWKQGELVQPIKIPEDMRTDTFYLGDFGLAMKLGNPVTLHGRPPLPYCSPDRLHNQDPSYACDMWSYMCIFAQLYFGFVPFSSWAGGGIVTSMVDVGGPLPKQWKGQYNEGLDFWYDQDNKIDTKANLEKHIMRLRPEADLVERQHVLSILSRGFSCFPEKRPTATQLLHDPSFRALINKYSY